MAKWTITPGTQGNNMSTIIDDLDIDRGTGQYQISQDVNAILEETKKDREKEAYFGRRLNNVGGFKKAMTIPDIVAIEINSKYGLDVYNIDKMEPADKARFFTIIEQQYPHLKSTEMKL